MQVAVKAFPNSGRQEVIESNGVLKIYLKSPAEGGKANKELVIILAKHFRVSASHIRIKSGLGSRKKTIVIEGV